MLCLNSIIFHQNKPYDPKKSCWVPDKSTGGFNEGLIESTEGEKVTVSAKGEVSGVLIYKNLSHF